MTDDRGLRINKFFTEHGFASRREADRWVAEGRVTINGRKAVPGDRVQPEDKIAVDGKIARPPQKKIPVILAYHKPPGVVCTLDRDTENNLADAIDYPERVFNIGRLDQFSEGLLLLTNLGEIVNKILRSKYGHEKEYIVDTNEPITDRDIEFLSKGVMILDRETLPCRIERLTQKRIRMVLTEGRNRQIRRMLEMVGLRASRLKRIRVMDVALGDIPRGEYRELSKSEVARFLKFLENSESSVAKK